jgi:hypothetical protein
MVAVAERLVEPGQRRRVAPDDETAAAKVGAGGVGVDRGRDPGNGGRGRSGQIACLPASRPIEARVYSSDHRADKVPNSPKLA